ANTPLLILGGKTGSGKTRLLVSFANSLDLEALARHRGSAFGPRVAAQPGQIDFENQLAIALLKLQQNPLPRVLLEDESRAIGSLSLPLQLHNRMRASPLAVIEEPVNYRAGIILNDYIRINFLEFRQTSPTDHHELFASYLTGSLGKIRKRLGGQLYSRIEQDMQDAISAHRQTDNLHVHQRWIETLLQTYYDPMYEYQLGKKLDHIIFRGNSEEFLAWAGHFNPLRAVNRSL
ncbi:MAG: tRNA 2-selenouridine(34) synthase MnmH, partial [Pseudohongiellaceae bacterium]